MTDTAVALIFLSPNLIISTQQKNNISNLIIICLVRVKRKQFHDLYDETVFF